MSQELDQIKQSASEAITHLREAKEKFGEKSAEFKTAIDKTDAALSALEKKNQELVQSIESQKSAAEEQKSRIQELEVNLARGMKRDGKAYKDSAEYKEFSAYVKEGKAMNIGTSSEGGYLAPTEMANQLIKQITEISPIRALASVLSISKRTIEMPKRTSLLAAAYEGEAEPNEQSQSAYGNETLTAHRLSTSVQYTRDLLMDSAFDLEALINADVAERFAQAEGNAFVLGDGVKKPEGFLVNAAVVAGAKDSVGVGVISADDLILLTGDLKVGYNPYFGFNRQTLAALRTLKGTTNDHYLWQMGLAPGAPNTIAGDPYVVIQDMPSIALGSLSVVYADFKKGYQIIDRTGLMMIRDELTGARRAQIEVSFHRWNHGQVILSEAFKVLRTKAS